MKTEMKQGVMPPPSKVLHVPTLIISDTHLSKRSVVEAELLLEMLAHTTCDTLILNGDIIDGWHIEGKKNRPFPEYHARVLDAINAKAATGTHVIYIPGNHDERLRFRTRQDMNARRTQKPFPAFAQDQRFSVRGTNLTVTIRFASDLMYKDPQGRMIRITHGDEFDPPWIGNTASRIGDVAYNGLVLANTAISEIMKKMNGGARFSIAKFVKKQTKNAVGIIAAFELAASNLPENINGLACGHIHHAEINGDMNGKLYANSGDWIESCTALTHDAAGNWRVIHWEEEREILGLKGKAKQPDANPYATYRPLTLRQLRLAQRMWPESNRLKMIKKSAKGKIKPQAARITPG